MLPRRTARIVLTAILLPACAPVGGAETTANTGAGTTPELVHCRTQIDRLGLSEMQLRTASNLGTAHLFDRSGRECAVRVHPDGKRIVFTRERSPGSRITREICISSVDGSTADTQLTGNSVQDDNPCWSPTGDRILFATARNGDSQLYLADADGQNQRVFLTGTAGTDDRDPDWSRSTDRIVFARRDPATGLRRLMLVNGDGTGLVPLTTGFAATAGDTEAGDRDPAFAPDGSRVAFVRLTGAGVGRLMSVDLTSGITTALYDPLGNVRYPRFSTGGERLFLGIDQPLEGRAGLRLYAIHSDGLYPFLVEPGKQWLCDGVDVLTMATAPTLAAPVVVDVLSADIQVASGTPTLGGRSQLVDLDGVTLNLATETYNTREVAGINCRFTLPVDDVNQILGLRAAMTAKVTRADAGSYLRSSLYNPVASRFDTVVEIADPGTGFRTFTFATQSLAHVSLQKDVRFTVIGDVSQGARLELQVDQVRLELFRAATPR